MAKKSSSRGVPASIRKNLIGDEYGRLTVIAFAGYRGSAVMWRCRCDCGDVSDYYRANLRSGTSTQCLKCNHNKLISASSSHGMHRTPTYRTWERVVRTENVCRRWEKFENFYEDMGKRPSVSHHLVRKDASKPWKPSNAEWMYKTKATRRSSKGHLITFRGKTQNLTAWAKEIGITRSSLAARLKAGWTKREALTTPCPPWVKRSRRKTKAKR